jgi:hypothetical protein
MASRQNKRRVRWFRARKPILRRLGTRVAGAKLRGRGLDFQSPHFLGGYIRSCWRGVFPFFPKNHRLGREIGYSWRCSYPFAPLSVAIKKKKKGGGAAAARDDRPGFGSGMEWLFRTQGTKYKYYRLMETLINPTNQPAMCPSPTSISLPSN